MMKIKSLKLSTISLSLVACFNTAYASSLMDVYQTALKSDPVLKQVVSQKLATDEGKNQAKAAFLPNINASASNKGFRTTTTSKNQSYNNQNYGINLRQSLYNRSNGINQTIAKHNSDAAQSDLDAANQDLMARVSQAYFNVLLAADSVEFAKAEQKAIARQLEQAKRRYEVGIIAITAVLNAQASFDSSQAAVLQAENEYQVARESLRDIAGQYFDKLNPLQDEIPLLDPAPNNIEEWVKIALDNNPQLSALNFQSQTSKQQISLQHSGHYPKLDLVAGLSYSDRNGPGSNGAQDGHDGNIGLELSVPIYQGGLVSSRVRQAEHNYQAIEDRKEQLRRNTERQTRSQFLKILTEISRVKALKQAVVSNDSSLKATEAGFEVGTRTIVDVLNVQRDRFRAKKDYSAARYNLILAHILLKQSAGILNEADLSQVDKWLQP